MNMKNETVNCKICQSTNIKINRGNTVFCNSCHYCVTVRGNVFRMDSHPMYEKSGCRIHPKHEDYALVKCETRGMKKPVAYIKRRPHSVWARDV